MKDSFKNFLYRLEDESIKNIWNNHGGVKKKFFDFFYDNLNKLDKPRIIEFGVRHGISTSLFLDLCKINDGFLYSIDENDYSEKFQSSNWKFIKSRDDNFDYLKKILPSKVDIIFLDTIHKADHVTKIFLNYFENLKVGGYFIIDDINWAPYLKGKKFDHFFKEINNKETFDSLIQIYSINSDIIDLKLNMTDTGCAIIEKLDDNKLIFNNKKILRQKSSKNYLRKLFQIFAN